jgi:acyl-CoA synthetase (AMP-forming)/AMP-acid ligase II
MLIIVDPTTLVRCPRDRIGEIWVAGPNVTQGYWNNPEATQQVFVAYTEDTHEGPFMRTGDLGFMHDGHLFLTGRLKELIIINGKNHYPTDIENTVRAVCAGSRLLSKYSAVFSVEIQESEQVVIIIEVASDYFANDKNRAEAELLNLGKRIRQQVGEIHKIPIHKVLFLQPGAIFRTPTSKVQRHACRKAYLDGTLKSVERSKVADKL